MAQPCLSPARPPDLLGRVPDTWTGSFPLACGDCSQPLAVRPWSAVGAARGYLVQEVPQAAGSQGQPGHPVRLCGVQVHEDRGVVVPGDALLREIELVDEAEDVAARTERAVSGGRAISPGQQTRPGNSQQQLPSKGSVLPGCLWDPMSAVSGPALGGHSTDTGEAIPSLQAWRGHSSVSAVRCGFRAGELAPSAALWGGSASPAVLGGPWPAWTCCPAPTPGEQHSGPSKSPRAGALPSRPHPALGPQGSPAAPQRGELCVVGPRGLPTCQVHV